MKIEWLWDSLVPATAGCFTIIITDLRFPMYLYPIDIAVHLYVSKQYRQWGYEEDWWDGPIHTYGWGPLFLIVWHDSGQI